MLIFWVLQVSNGVNKSLAIWRFLDIPFQRFYYFLCVSELGPPDYLCAINLIVRDLFFVVVVALLKKYSIIYGHK